MFGEKNLKEEVKELGGRLEALEHKEFGSQIEELRKALRDIEKSNQGNAEELRKANHKLALKLSRVQVIGAILLTITSGLAVNYAVRYYRETDQAEVYEALTEVFQNRLGDTIDHISLLAPSDGDKAMVKELSDMEERLDKQCTSNTKLKDLCKLTNALKQIVIDGKSEGAREQLNTDMLASSGDRFVASRARLLESVVDFPDGLCDNPDYTLDSIDKVLAKDNGVVAAISLRGVCHAQQAWNSLKEVPEEPEKRQEKWEEGVEKISEAIRDNEYAYYFKPSHWARLRFLNNKVWSSMQFLSAAILWSPDMNEPLRHVGRYKDMEDYFADSHEDIKECLFLSNDQATYLETEAEFYALRYKYYTSGQHADDAKAKAKEADDMVINKLNAAFGKGLLRLRSLNTLESAEMYFKKDVLLRPYFTNPEDHTTIDIRIKNLIVEALHRQ